MAGYRAPVDHQHLPEVDVSVTQPQYSALHPYEDYEYFVQPASPPPPAPEYRQYPASPPLSHASPRLTSERATSPSVGDLNTLDKHRPLSPAVTHYSELVSPDPETVYPGPGEKEVYRQSIYPVVADYQPIAGHKRQERRQKKRVCGLPQRLCCVLALIVLAIIAIAVALGVVFGTKKSHHAPSPPPPSPTSTAVPQPTGNPNFSVGGDLSPQYYSKEGAFNGSGIAIASVNFGIDSSIYIFFQHYTGEIQQFISKADGEWDQVTTITTTARNATPLSAVAYIVNEVAIWHVFYIDQDLFVRQRISSNTSAFQTNIWTDGPLNALNLKANDADMIGLQGCYWGNFYGDSDGTYNDGFNSSAGPSAPQTGIHLWYAADDTTFAQYSWTNGDDQWKHDQDWGNMNARAGVGCQTWLSGTTSYVTMIDLDNALNIFWKDTNVTTNATAAHPINEWTNTSISIPNVHPSTSMGHTNYLAYQAADFTIHGANISWAAENTTIFPAADGSGPDEFAIDTPALPGTHLSITSLADQSGGAHLAVFFQEKGDDFLMWSRDNSGGSWTSAPLDVSA